MTTHFNNKFIELSKSVNLFLQKKHKEYNFKTRDTSLIEGLLFKLLLSEINSTQEKVTLKINNYNNVNVNRISYYKRAEKLNIYPGGHFIKIYLTIYHKK